MKYILFIATMMLATISFSQQKFLFDASKAETAGNADWVIDADKWNLDYTPNAHTGGYEANAQKIPTPSQNNISSGTKEYYWKGALSAWGIELVKKGYYVETLPYNGDITYLNPGNPQDLSNYDVFVVCEPNIKFTNSEKSAIIHFVKDGGGLFMISDHDNSDRNGDGYDSPAIWNDLINNNSVTSNPFGIKFDYEFFNEQTNNILNTTNDPLINGPYGKVTRVEFYGGTSMTLYPNQNSSVKGVVYEEGSSTSGTKNVMCAYARFGTGKVVALGDSSPADDGTGDNGDHLYDGWLEDANGNHRKLIMNGCVWLATPTSAIVTPEPASVTIDAFGKNNAIVFSVKGIKSATGFLVSVYDLTGRVINTVEKPSAETRFEIEVPARGLYLYSLVTKNKTAFTGKVMVP